MILKNLNKEPIKDILIKLTIKIIPLIIISVIFTFGETLSTSSLGMATFWGFAIIYIYNILFTKTILEMMKN